MRASCIPVELPDIRAAVIAHMPFRLGDNEAMARLKAAGIGRGDARRIVNDLIQAGAAKLEVRPGGAVYVVAGAPR